MSFDVSRAPRLRRLPSLTLSVAALVAALPAVAIAATPAETVLPSIHASPGGRCADGPANPGTKVTLTMKSAAGKVIERHEMTTGVYWQICFDGTIKPGRTLTLTWDDGTVTKRTVTVPQLSAAIDRVTNTLTGATTLRGTFQGTLYDCDPADCGDPIPFTVKPGTNGSFRKVLTAFDVRGSDRVTLSMTVGQDEWITESDAPYVVVGQDGPTRIGIYRASPGAWSVDLRSSSGAVRAHLGQAAAPWVSDVYRFRKNGAPVRPRAGDRIVSTTIAPDVSLLLHRLVLELDPDADLVTGECYAGQVGFAVVEQPGVSFTWTDFIAAPDGRFVGSVALDAGDEVTVTCEDKHGDRVILTGSVPTSEAVH